MKVGARRIKLVDEDTGQVLDDCPICEEYSREAARQRKIIADLRADKLGEAMEHPLYEDATTLFHEWKIATGKAKSRWPGPQGDRFWLCLPYLKTDGFVICRWAVWGVAYMPYTRQLPTGKYEIYQDWETVFKSRSNFERFALRGYESPEARGQFSLREQGFGPEDSKVDPEAHFAKPKKRRRRK